MAGLLESTVIRAVCKKMLQILLRHLLSFFIKFFLVPVWSGVDVAGVRLRDLK
jgi:hypothetical protein